MYSLCYVPLPRWYHRPKVVFILGHINPDIKVHGATTGYTWVLSAPDGPHVGPMNLAIRESMSLSSFCRVAWRGWKLLNRCILWSLCLRCSLSPPLSLYMVKGGVLSAEHFVCFFFLSEWNRKYSVWIFSHCSLFVRMCNNDIRLGFIIISMTVDICIVFFLRFAPKTQIKAEIFHSLGNIALLLHLAYVGKCHTFSEPVTCCIGILVLITCNIRNDFYRLVDKSVSGAWVHYQPEYKNPWHLGVANYCL